MTSRIFLKIIILSILGNATTFSTGIQNNAAAADSLYKILPDTIEGVASENMMQIYLRRLVEDARMKWQNSFEIRIKKGNNGQYYQRMRAEFIRAIGGLPERTPLNPVVTGILRRKNFRVEKVIFESRPHHYVTASLFLPDDGNYPQPWPGVLIPCGHYNVSKAHDEYQSMGALLAINGMAALVYDPIDQGERLQIRGKNSDFPAWGTRAHTINDIRAILLGNSVSGYMIWDGMRAIDYLISRPEIDPERIGCTGNSGGGTQASYLTALDELIRAAAPSCYLHHLESQIKNSMGDAEQNIFGQLTFGMDHPDYVMMRAPVPIKILAATHDFFKIDAVWETFRYVKRYYTSIGYSENVDILENDTGHNYNRKQREAAARWFARWLQGNEREIREPELDHFTEEELYCTPKGQTLLMPDAKSIQDLQIEQLERYKKFRIDFWKNNSAAVIRDTIRRISGVRSYGNVRPPHVEFAGTYDLGTYTAEKLIIQPEKGIYLPAIYYRPKNNEANGIVIYLNQEGKVPLLSNINEIENLIHNGKRVLLVDLRGTGETAQTKQAKFSQRIALDWEDWYTAYLLGRNYVSMRCEDLYACVKYMENSALPLTLIAIGKIGIPAMHAAALEPDLFSEIKITGCLRAWEDIIRSTDFYGQLDGIVRGALQYYDLPELVSLIGDKIKVSNPANALGITEKMAGRIADLSDKPELPGLAGTWYGSLDLIDPVGPDPISTLDLNWDQSAQRGRTWSAEWYGWIIAPQNGTIRIEAACPHELHLQIGDRSTLHLNKQNQSGSVRLEAIKGDIYPIYIRYNQDAADSGSLSIKWQINNGLSSRIPAEALIHSPQQHYRMDPFRR